ncbi:hypothetical protein BD408DRAFT_408813, partial [Parasitella parasitica]
MSNMIISQSTFPSHQYISGLPLITDDFESLFHVIKKLPQSDRPRRPQLFKKKRKPRNLRVCGKSLML